MKGLNRAYLIGTIQDTPELGVGLNNTPFLKLVLATPASRKTIDPAGNAAWVDVPDYHRLLVSGEQANWLSKHGRKGDILGVECILKPGRWTDRDGFVHYSMDVVVERILLLESRGEAVAPPPISPLPDPPIPDGSGEAPF